MAKTRRGWVYNHGLRAGLIEERPDGTYRFVYEPSYLAAPSSKAISLTLPKQPEPYESDHLFPFFHGLLSEGETRRLQCRLLRIDEADDFGLLLATGGDMVGSVTVELDET